MDDINQLRRRVDEVDEQIVQLLSKRTEISRSVGLLKRRQKMSIRDISRENEVFSHVRKKAAALSLDPVQVEAIYRQIVNMCMAVQELKEE